MRGIVIESTEDLTRWMVAANIADLAAEPSWLVLKVDECSREVVEWLRAQPVPVLGVGDVLSEAADLTVPSASALVAVTAAIEANPVASAVLVQLLRATSAVPPAEALRLESMAYAMLQAGAEYAAWVARQPARPLPELAEPLLLERVGSTLTLQLNAPERRNALSAPMRDALSEAFQLVLADPTITSVEVRGVGSDFCAGGDLAEFSVSGDVTSKHAIRQRRMPAQYLLRCAERCTMFVHGACIGAGIELPAFAGRLVARPDARFRLPEVGMGLIPGAGGCVSIPRRIGRQRAAWLAITGTTIDAQQALSWGLIDEVQS